MADQPQEPLTVAQPDAGLTFRAEMFMTNVVLGYWKIIVSVIVVFLIGMLGYGQFQTWYKRKQHQVADQNNLIFERFSKGYPGKLIPVYSLPSADFRPFDPTSDEGLPEDLAAAAKMVEDNGGQARGVAAVESFLYAAELYRLAGKPAESRAALEMCIERDKNSLFGFSAQHHLAMLDASEGRVDEAVATLGKLVETPLTDTLKQQASLSLARVYRDAGQLSDAKAAYETFLSAYPESVQKDTVEAEMNALASEGPAEGDNEPVVSPTENPAPEEVPDPPIEEATEPEETTEPPAGEGSPE